MPIINLPRAINNDNAADKEQGDVQEFHILGAGTKLTI